MKSAFQCCLSSPLVRGFYVVGLSALLAFSGSQMAAADTTLADQPVSAGAVMPGNMALALSVEYPTAISVANLQSYSDVSTYLGYFDPFKCYDYTYNSATPSGSYFQPSSLATGTNKHSCSSKWSGNFMNWATMQTIDPFRWALSGGYRSEDTTTSTILEKAWASSQGSASANYPDRGTNGAAGNVIASSLISSVTPFPSSWSNFNFRIWGNGNRMVFSGNSSAPTGSGTELSTLSSLDKTKAYQVYVRVKVCDATTSMGTGGLEANCVPYGSNYKPEGLLQQYSNQMRFSAFGYLNGDGATRQGGVLREPMGYIGPTYPQPTSGSVVTNTKAEWDSNTGVMYTNPDTALATGSSVTQSGVMNYLNKFGQSAHGYMTDDNVSELYYAAVRYFENLGNVPEWTNNATPTEKDGFPVPTTWTDPIQYSCQKNFILGIGDDHTHVDYNVGTGTTPAGMVATGGRTKPSAVTNDALNLAASWTDKVETMEGSPTTHTPWFALGAGQATYYIAGLAYGAHVLDLRPEATMPGTQSISTYWMDVMEGQRAEDLNQYYLAAKYGGFTVPSGYSISNTTALPQSEWDPNGNTISMNGTSRKQPDNYFLAGNATQMVTGLKAAFKNISNAIQTYTTSFSLSTPVIATAGTTSFATQYDAGSWTGVLSASTLKLASNGTPTLTPLWNSSSTLQTQLAGTGWDTGRRIATWNGTQGVAFRSGNLSATQLAALAPSYSTSTTGAKYLNYLRGDQTDEVGSTASGSTQSLRARKYLLGDIVDAKLTPVPAPSMSYSDSFNPGYSTFKSSKSSRPLVVYAAANDGMLHAFLGSNGTEQFAYVPSALINGPTSHPQVDGLAQLGNPNYVHHNYVNATPLAFDIDLANAGGSTSATPNWHTLLIGGLGKGGKSYYAIDVTDPAGMTTEAIVAGKVKWEFTDTTMGYSFGAPIVVKTLKYGWVVALTSGYNNSDGIGYLYLVNPNDGTLLEKIATPSSSNGLTKAAGYVRDFTDFTADSIYAGDLDGQVWRFELTAATGTYPAATLLATLKDASNHAQPITTEPLIAIYPTTRKRYVMVGTGQLLSALDTTSSGEQTFYAIVDGTTGAFSAVASPVTRSTLQQVTDVTAGAPSPAAQGWYTDLGTTSNVGWRVVVNPVAYSGIASFSTLLPQGDACSPGGKSRVYAINYGSGTSVLTTTNSSTTIIAYASFDNAITDLSFVTTVPNNPELVAGTSVGAVTPVPANLGSAIATRLLNWREIPTVE